MMSLLTTSATHLHISVPSMAVFESPTMGAPWVTETVLGEPVQLLEIVGEWARVVLPLQHTSLDPRGYPGWVRSDALQPTSTAPTLQTVVACACVRDAAGQETVALPMGSLLIGVEGETNNETVPVHVNSNISGFVAAQAVATLPLAVGDRELILRTLDGWRGLPYVWGGTSTCTGADCSGLVHRTYQRAGMQLPRDAKDQFEMVPSKGRSTLEGALPGDLVFFQHSTSREIDHVGVYLGEEQYLSARRTAGGVSVDPVFSDEHPYVGWASYLPR